MLWRSKKSPQICWHNIYQVIKNKVIHRFKSSAQKRKNLIIFSVFVCNRCNDNGEHQRHWNVCNSRVFKTYNLKCIFVTCYNSKYEGHCRPWETIIEQAHCVAKFIQSIFAFFSFLTAKFNHSGFACRLHIGLIGCHKHWNNKESLYSLSYQYQFHPYLIKSLLRLSANCSARIILSAPNSLYHYMIIWRQVISTFDS